MVVGQGIHNRVLGFTSQVADVPGEENFNRNGGKRNPKRERMRSLRAGHSVNKIPNLIQCIQKYSKSGGDNERTNNQ